MPRRFGSREPHPTVRATIVGRSDVAIAQHHSASKDSAATLAKHHICPGSNVLVNLGWIPLIEARPGQALRQVSD